MILLSYCWWHHFCCTIIIVEVIYHRHQLAMGPYPPLSSDIRISLSGKKNKMHTHTHQLLILIKETFKEWQHADLPKMAGFYLGRSNLNDGVFWQPPLGERRIAGEPFNSHDVIPIGSMYAIYGNIYHQYTSNVSIYTIHGSYGIWSIKKKTMGEMVSICQYYSTDYSLTYGALEHGWIRTFQEQLGVENHPSWRSLHDFSEG